MTYDYYADLDTKSEFNPQCARGITCLASGFADECVIWSCRKEERGKQGKKIDHKNNARKCYQEKIRQLSLEFPPNIQSFFSKPDFNNFPSHWVSLEIPFTLQTPWYSKDDKPFHVLDNPLHKDKVFGVPFMPASVWKGLLRWACRMQAGLFGNIDNWKDEKDDEKTGWIFHLFGNDKKEEDIFQHRRGALVFYPTWFSKIGFEVINPHSRKTRAGTVPIFYEVVPAGTKGTLYLLYAPMNIEESKKYRKEALKCLVTATEQLLTVYGFSAKRTAGWGIATVKQKDINDIKQRLGDYYDKNG
jgi:CRISPR-associated protein Cmr2